MHRIISWYNQNRRKIWGIIITIIIISAIVWRLINTRINENQYNENLIANSPTLNSITMPTQKSAISKDNVIEDKKGINVIDEFITYCNSGKIDKAYELISNECKEEMYPELKNFENMYYKPVFENGKRNVEVQNWIGNIYKIDYNEDILATGKYNKNNALQDYITVVKDNEGNYKLNINKYIETTQIDISKNFNDIEMKILNKDIYMDYEIYTFEIKNNSQKIIALLDIQNLDSTYLLDDNNLKYRAYLHELSQAQVIVNTGETKKIKIKYYNEYSSSRSIKSLIFDQVILNYNEAEKAKNNYSDYITAKFDL